MPPPSAFQLVWTRTYEPIFKHVSVPGTYQKPAPYRLQTFTYSTGLAFTGRSAACAPATATRPAAEPRRRLLTIRMNTLQFGFPGGCPPPGATMNFRSRKSLLALNWYKFGCLVVNHRMPDLARPPAHLFGHVAKRSRCVRQKSATADLCFPHVTHGELM